MKTKISFLIFFCVMASSLCHAVDYTWNGAGIADWSDANNWIPVGVPGSNDTAIINAGDVFLYSNTTVAGLSLTGGRLRGNGGIWNITVTSNFTWTGGTFAALTNNVSVGATMTITGNDDKAFGGLCILNNYGTATWSGNGRILSTQNPVSGANIIKNFSGAFFEAQGTTSIERISYYDPTLVLNNSGTFRKTGVGTTNTLDTVFNNTGTLEVLSGTLNTVTTINNNGTAQVQGGGALEIGNGTSTGVFDVRAAGTLNFISGLHALNGAAFTNLGSIVISGGGVSFKTATVVPGTVTLSGGIIGSTNEVTFQSLTWTGGKMGDPFGPTGSSGGVTKIAPGGTLTISGSDTKALDGYTLNNYGTVTLSGSGTFYFASKYFEATIYNASNGVFDVQSDAAISYYNSFDPVSLFINEGVFRKSGGTNTTVFTEELDNYGLLQVLSGGLGTGYFFANIGTAQVQNGRLRVNDASYNSGHFDVSAGGAIEFTGDLNGYFLHTFQTNSTITGAGTLHFLGGIAYLNGTNLIAGSTQVSGGYAYFDSAQSFGSSNAPLVIDGGVAFIDVAVVLPSVTISGGSLAGTNELTIPNGGVLTWTGGAMGFTVPGVTTIAPGGTLAISGSGDKSLQGRTINNQGTAIWSGSGRILTHVSSLGSFPNTINNLSGAVFEAQNTASIEIAAGFDPILVFNNSGTFRKTGPGTTNKLQAAVLNNNGTLELQNGKLQLNNGYSPASTGTVSFPISGPTAGVGFGQLEASYAPLDGNFNVSLTNGFRPTSCDTFNLIQFGFKTGSFANTNGLNLGGGVSFIMNFSDTNLTLVTSAPQPCLGSAGSLTNGQFQFQLTGQVGSNYIIQASTNLTNWIPIATNVIPGSGILTITDPSVMNYSRRFFRALFVP